MAARCQFWLSQKGRHCSGAAGEESQFCRLHQEGKKGADEAMQRIPCPLDSKHTIYEANVAKHVRQCTMTRDRAYEACQPFVWEGCNVVPRICAISEGTGSARPKAKRTRQQSDVAGGATVAAHVHAEDESCVWESSAGVALANESKFSTWEARVNDAFSRCCKYLEITAEYLLQSELQPLQYPLARVLCDHERHGGELVKKETGRNATLLREIMKSANRQHDTKTDVVSSLSQLMADNPLLEFNAESRGASSQESNFSRTYAVAEGSGRGQQCDSGGAAHTSWDDFLAANASVIQGLDRHDIQNVSILSLCISEGYVEVEDFHVEGQVAPTKGDAKIDVSDPLTAGRSGSTLFVEFGAGRAGLTRWKILACEVMAAHTARGEAPMKEWKAEFPRFIIVEREMRRYRREVRDSEMKYDAERNDVAFRFRTDIADFHFLTFLRFAASSPHGAEVSLPMYCTHIPRILRQVHSYDAGFPPDVMVRNMLSDEQLSGGCGASCSKEATVATPRPSGPAVLDSERANRLRQVLLRMGRGRNPPLDALEKRLRSAFASWRFGSKLVCTAKHLCGDGTDLALRCTVNGLTGCRSDGGAYDGGTDANTRQQPVRAMIVIATCCHHLCDSRRNFAGLQFLQQELGFSTQRDFQLLAACAGWATGASGRKQAIGLKIKRVLDTCRVWWLRQMGFKASLKVFVPSSVSPENVVIVAEAHSEFPAC